ncbi:hypothetical protein M2316_000239 [Cellulosimicrobium cellulans]|nr:hypothetical protein [Cellulosimicrobium cellulans]
MTVNAIVLSADDEPDEGPPPEAVLPVVRVVASDEQEFSDFLAGPHDDEGAAPGRARRPRGVGSSWSPRATAGQRRTTAWVLPSTRAPSNVTVRSTRTVPASASIAPTVPVTSSVATPGFGTGTGRVKRVW